MDAEWPFDRQYVTLRLPTRELGPGQDVVDVADPFLVLSDRGAFSRVLLAELVGPSDGSVLFCALKIQSDEYPVPATHESDHWNNEAIEQAWSREIALLERCGPENAGIAAPLEAMERRPHEASRLAPTIFCKRKRAFFTACCPDCGGPLSDYRDSRRLEERGLPRYDSSLVRFLACATCIANDRTWLWTLVQDPDGAWRDVGDQSDLFRAFSRLARAPIVSARSLPCQECEHVDTCYPDGGGTRGDAPRLLTPVTFYESQCVALELLHFRYDEYAALLGGATFSEVAAQFAEPGRMRAVQHLETRFGPTSQYLFAQDVSGKLGIEVLRLKVELFRQLCRAVATLHRHSQEPHLGIAPSRAMVKLSESTASLPNLWNFGVVLLGLGSARPRKFRDGTPSHLPATPYAPPRLIDPVYSSSRLFAAPPAEQACTLTIRRFVSSDPERSELELEIESDSVDLAELGDKDVVEVSAVQGRPPLALRLIGAPTGMNGRALLVRAAPLRVDTELRANLEQVLGRPLSRARFTIYPSLHVPCDVYGLGMMLLTTVLVHEQNTPVAVARAVSDLARELSTFAAEHSRAGNEEIGTHASRLVQAAAMDRAVFAKGNLFAHPELHQEAAAAIPDSLWADALTLGLRAVTTIRGFSVCRSWSDFDPAHPEIQAEYLLQLTTTLVRKLDSVLFGLPGRDREIRNAIAAVADELMLAPEAEVG